MTLARDLRNYWRRWQRRKPICVLTNVPHEDHFWSNRRGGYCWCIDIQVTDALCGAGLKEEARDYQRAADELAWQEKGPKERFLDRLALAMQYVEVR